MDQPAVEFEHVSKQFRLGQTHDSLRDLLASGMRRLVGKAEPAKKTDTLWAVRDVDFQVQRGDALGIIGPNGAGKSTILKLLAGILRPDRGTIHVNGRLAALIEVGAGFHGDLTGRENLYLNGSILGMKRNEIRGKLDSIVAFAGLERFMDTPVKRYSSGMYARLGFSIAAHVDPDVFLVDEVLSVGDAVFRLRCLERMRELLKGGTTLVFVTHDLEQMQGVCKRAIVLEQGGIAYHGSAHEAVSHYLGAMSRSYAERPPDLMDGQDRDNGAVKVTRLRFINEAGDDLVWIRPNQPVRLELDFELARAIPSLVIELNMRAKLHENLLSVNSGRDGLTFDAQAGQHTATLQLPSIPLTGGQYVWNVRMWDGDSGVALIDSPFRFPMAIDDNGLKTGVVCLPHDWTLTRKHELSLETIHPGLANVVADHSVPAAHEETDAVTEGVVR